MGWGPVPPMPDQLDLVNLVDNITAWAFNILPNATSSVAESSHIVSTRRCILFGFTASSTLAAIQWIHLFDQQTLPANGAVPALSFEVQSTNGASAQWFPGRFFRSGIVIANSTTQNSLTLGAANCLFDVNYL